MNSVTPLSSSVMTTVASIQAMKTTSASSKLFSVPTTFDKDIQLSDLTWVRALGVGGFSTVDLIRTGGVQYAVKKVQHSDMDSEVETQLQNELEILKLCTDSKFIVKFYNSFRLRDCYAILLEPCLGGDLWSLLQLVGFMKDEQARFYVGCVVEGLKYLQDRNVLYRDIKPENLLLDSNTGYLKIADFGFSKLLMAGDSSLTRTVVGTAEYLPPEAVSGQGYHHKATLWALGILMFELLTGSPPFLADDRPSLFSKILAGFRHFSFPANVSSAAAEVIRMLCRLLPHQRPGLDVIIRFSWFNGFDWKGLKEGTLLAPSLQEEGEKDGVTLEEVCTDTFDEF